MAATQRDQAAAGNGSDPRLAAFRPIHQRKAAEEVLLVLADAIRSGLYRPGEHLPTVRELSQVLSVSNAVIREAVEILREAGIVSVKRGNTGGILIESTVNLPVVLRRASGETHANILALLQVRRPLEMTAAALAAEHASDAELDHLRDLVDELAELLGGPPEEFVNKDAMFHYALAEHSGNRVLSATAARVFDQVHATLAELPSGHIGQERALKHQRRTMKAIESRDRRRAIRAMDNHLAELEEAVLGERLPRT